MKYKWRRQPKKAPTAQITGECIEAIKAKRGGITRQLLVIEAQKKSSPIHDCFEWDNDKAAGEHRLEQARKLLQCLVIVIEQEDTEETICVRAFIAPSDIGKESGSGYLTISEVVKDEDLAVAYKETIMKEFRQVQTKATNYAEFAKVCLEIDKVKI